MTKPVSRLDWYPDALDAQAVWASWMGAGWHYRIEWGDGTSDRVLFWQPPVKHRYAKPGTYQVVTISDLSDKITASVPVTVRAALAPHADTVLLDDKRTVRLNLGALDSPVHYRVVWGDDRVTEHGANDLKPEHTYPWGFGKTSPLVTDLPARRSARITGPDIAPAPVELLPYWSWTSGVDQYHPVLHWDKLPPGATWTLYWHGSSTNQVGTGVVDSGGRFSQPVEIMNYSGTTRNPWFVWTLVVRNGDREHRWAAYYLDRSTGGEVYPTFAWFPTDPARIVVSVFQPIAGTYQVDWGDGTARTPITSDGRTAWAEHRYATPGAARTVTVTDPQGRKGTVALGPCTVRYAGNSGAAGSLDFSWGNQPDFAGLTFQPAVVDWGAGLGPIATIPVAGRSNDGSKAVVVGNHYGSEWAGREVTATASSPWSTSASKTVVLRSAALRWTPGDGAGGTVALSGFPPESDVTLRLGGAGLGTVLTDKAGNGVLPVTLPEQAEHDRWYSIDAEWGEPGDPDRVRRHSRIPVRYRLFLDHAPVLVYDWEDRDPALITVHAQVTDEPGDWTIDWGDGERETVSVAAGAAMLRATHRYLADGPVTVTATGPAGTRAVREVRPGAVAELVDWTSPVGLAISWSTAPEGACEAFAPARVDCGDGRVYEIHRPDRDCSGHTYTYIGFANPGTYRVTVSMPMRDPITYTYTQAGRGPRGDGESEVQDHVRTPTLTAAFHTGETSTPGRYTGWFDIANTGGDPAAWALEFTLAAPALLASAESWQGTATVTDLGGGRWRITGDQAVPPGGEARVDVVVDPAATPTSWPDHITVTTP